MQPEDIKEFCHRNDITCIPSEYVSENGEKFVRIEMSRNGKRIADVPGKDEDEAIVNCYKLLKKLYNLPEGKVI